LTSSRGEKRHAKNHWCVDEILEIDISADTLTLQIVGCQIDNLCGAPGHFNGSGGCVKTALLPGLSALMHSQVYPTWSGA
jgi:hypothetical protein